MVLIENISFKYDNSINNAGLADVSLNIPRGQVVLLCGESGSGKTTFARLLNGLIPNYYDGQMSGTVEVFGKEVDKTPLYELAPIVGSVFQNPKSQFYTLLTDTEIVFACENLGLEKEEILRRFEQTINAFEIKKLFGKSLFTLSGGEKQKVACASVNTLMPELFVLDEPTSNLDVKAIDELSKILRHWKKQEKTIVIAEHRLSWLKDIVDRVLYFDGNVRMYMTADAFWKIPKEELQGMGLRAPIDFSPQRVREFTDFMECRGFKTQMLDIPRLTIPQGATVAVLGNNGAGKTTFARMLCGLVKKAEGTLLYKGKEYSPKKRTALCYMVMQDVNHQLFTESVEDEVRLGVDMKSEQEKRKLVDDILVELDLTDYKEAHPMSLSGGQRQRVAIAGALATQRDVIIYDEPTSGLDYRHMKDVARNIRKLSEWGKTQFVITHDAELVAECCDYFIFMENGKVLCSGGWTVDNVEYVRAYFKI